jgi:hypothetical protein
MASGVSEILRKISCALRTEGPRHLLAAVGHDLARAIGKVTTSLSATIGGARDRCARAIAAQVGTPAWSQHTLQLVYDVAASPATFDFARHLAAAEVQRRRRGLDAINVVFVAAPEIGEPVELPDEAAVEEIAAQRARLDTILVPMLALLPSVRSFAVCGSRSEAQALIARDPAKVYPSSYRVHAPRQASTAAPLDNGSASQAAWPMLRATDAGRQAVTEFLEREARGRRPVVITLRNCDNGRSRNGRAKDWLAFADGLDPAVYAPIFVHDADQMLRGVPCDSGRHIVCHAASWSLDIRMALYEAAWLNVAVMHGPMELCRHSERARYLLFVAPEMAADAAPEEGCNRLWVDFEFAKPYQRMVWKRVHLAALQEAFADMERALASQPRG